LKGDFGIKKPKLAVLGLNPHAGENGLLGNEEIEIIQPVIKHFKEKGHLVVGPFPADGFFAAGTYRQYDAVLAMYHDQGLIPFKTLAFNEGVNFTAGFRPSVRLLIMGRLIILQEKIWRSPAHCCKPFTWHATFPDSAYFNADAEKNALYPNHNHPKASIPAKSGGKQRFN
jgi:4-hydroxythreonine-4-phosphate dehydrogenase